MAAYSEDSLEGRLRERATTKKPLDLSSTTSHNGNIPNTLLAVSTLAFVLGSIFSLGLTVFLSGGFNQYFTYQLAFFMSSWAFFHWAEFAVTAGYNLEKCSTDSYLLDNGLMYHVANGVALSEYLITLYFKPIAKTYPYISEIGILMVIVGQGLRSLAMIHASTNFSHIVAFKKREAHRLVTDGVYAWFRHPSYAGFFYWALGTQLVLQNPLSLALYCVLLWRFFYYRIRGEEVALIKFFGDEYISYRKRVGTKIPFVP